MTDDETSLFLITALDDAAIEFDAEHEHDEPPTHLYLDRSGVDHLCQGEWSVVFIRDLNSDPLDMSMTRWATGDAAAKLFKQCIGGESDIVEANILGNWDSYAECDVCGKMKPDVHTFFSPVVGDTSACAYCRGEKETPD